MVSFDSRGKRAQARLHVFDPAAAFAFEARLGEKPRKKFKAAKRIADLMGQERGHFNEGALAAQIFRIALQLLGRAHIAEDIDGTGLLRLALEPGMTDRHPGGLCVPEGFLLAIIRRCRIKLQFTFTAGFTGALERGSERGRQSTYQDGTVAQGAHRDEEELPVQGRYRPCAR